MKDFRSSSLRSLLTETAPILVLLPPRVLQQLVGYYGDWRRSRDILNETADESRGAGRPHPGSNYSGSSRINRSSLWRW